jgi:multidrug resistance efflux pump
VSSARANVAAIIAPQIKRGFPMNDEERQRAMDFIVETLARLSVNDQTQGTRLDKLIESHEKAEHRLDRDERIFKLMIRAGRCERRTRSEADERLTNALADLAEAQKRTEDSIAHTDSKLDALVDIVRQQRNGHSS